MLVGISRLGAVLALPVLVLTGCVSDGQGLTRRTPAPAQSVGLAPAQYDGMIARYARLYRVPQSLIRRIIVRESGYNPGARNGPYWGMMQILYPTARTMGYQGKPSGLLDADTNLRYGVRYLSGAYMVARGNQDRAVGFYARGYYYDAKRMGLLDETGLGHDRRRRR